MPTTTGIVPLRALMALAATLLCLAGLSACGQSEAAARAEKEGKVVGEAIQAQSEESGSDITTTLTENPWEGESDAFVSGTFDNLVVNTQKGGCAKLVFESDEAGADYTIEKSYEC